MRHALLILLGLVMTSTSLAQGTGADVPVQRVILFTSGVGYFEHGGSVRGDGTAELHFQADQINDVLKSLVLQDLGGGTVGSVVYPSQDPLERTLRSFAVDLTDNPSLGALLSQLRGAAVRVQAGGATLRGTILGVEQQRTAREAGVVEAWVVHLLTEGGVQSAPLTGATAVELEDPALRDELAKALEALAQARDRNRKTVTVQFRGTGTRRVRIGYVVEAPVWKTSYRLLLPEGDADEGYLQGWAIVENQTETDWEDVDLALVSGRPISFVQDLYEPLYVDRPVVEPEQYRHLRPRVYEGDVAVADEEMAGEVMMKAEDAAGRSFVRMAPSAAAPEARERLDLTASVAAQATGQDVGELFEYRVGDVRLPRQRSAMLPIVARAVRAERLSLYNAEVLAAHPLHGARLVNDTGLHLAQGPATVFDDGAYAGDARLPDVPPGQERYLSYAVDQGVQVRVETRGEAETIETARIVKGVLELRRMRARTTVYTLANEDDRDRRVVVEHPFLPGWTLADTSALLGSTDRFHRLGVDVPASETVHLSVREEDEGGETIALLQASPEVLLRYSGTSRLSEGVRHALRRAVELRRALEETDRQIREREQALAEITREQQRLRDNMGAVDRDSDYYRRLLQKLSEQEDEVERLQAEVRRLRQQRAERLREFEAYVASLDVR